LYRGIHNSGLRYTDVSERVKDYLEENLLLIDYLSENVELRRITLDGDIIVPIQSFEDFAKKTRKTPKAYSLR
jgi:hypothetical protein